MQKAGFLTTRLILFNKSLLCCLLNGLASNQGFLHADSRLDGCPGQSKILLGALFMLLVSSTPRVTSYAELGGSWNSEVNNGIHARQGSV